MSYYDYENYDSSEDEDEYEDEYVPRKSVDLIDLYGEIIVNGVRYDADGDVIMAV
jgi:hypothetical protein